MVSLIVGQFPRATRLQGVSNTPGWVGGIAPHAVCMEWIHRGSMGIEPWPTLGMANQKGVTDHVSVSVQYAAGGAVDGLRSQLL